MNALRQKQAELEAYLKERGSVAIGFSGGVDSSFLLAMAAKVLGNNALAVIGRSPTYPKRELEEAVKLAESLGARYQIIDTEELKNPEFRHNPPHRCFVCKTTLFRAVFQQAKLAGIHTVMDGSNADDVADFRPGMQAAEKLGVRSPLKELGFTKQEIRDLSKAMGLPTWQKPAFACLSSRIPYGEEISEERLTRIELAEEALKKMGLRQYRVRDHREVARIEVTGDDIVDLTRPARRVKVVAALKRAGYRFVCLDLEGYRTGAMNSLLSDADKNRAELKER